MSEQSHVLNKGLHIVVATPGRLIDMLEKKRFGLDSCKFLCMDEADRMIDLGFEDDVRNIMSFFTVSEPTANQKVENLSIFTSASAANTVIFCYYAP